ncbi:Tetratricopeptide repeat protein [Maioricimonas rarisocia]|uniref:Tetratricopeptide repeat protein n=1 Tax=Maioricimonas rarisocia TaxID=2528026 RepID=A0A517Z4H1_9PLAN|nr:multiheme c-type cytochrome [Maioricimonas rarisocia]QDU37376.1 Tetratricopeptide repeat protein [Maioricimonas rarisocia]
MKSGIGALVFVLIGAGVLAAIGFAIAKRADGPEPDAAEVAENTAPAFTPPEVPPPPSQAYAGSQACAECHDDVSEHFRAHPMGRSLAAALEASKLEDYGRDDGFKLPLAPSATFEPFYFAEIADEAVMHHEMAIEKSGETIYDQAVPIAYTVGSGQRGRSYLINRDGLLFMSPMTWYSTKDQWDLSPGYERNNLHFGRRIVDGCLQCHAGRVAQVETNRYKAQPFIEASIGCERCHGPSQGHVDYWRAGGSDEKPDPILKLAELPRGRRDHVCFQCHLVGEQRLVRYGRNEFDFRPGDHVGDIWTIFLHGTGIEEGDGRASTEAVSQVEQMLSSVCYQKSNGALGCTSCHDPHSIPSADNRVEFYRSACLNCHGPDSTECSKPLDERLEVTAEDSCIACHMAPVAANDVPHTSQTDHRILRRPLEEALQPRAGGGLLVFGESEGVVPESEAKRGRAIFMVRTAEQADDAAIAVEAIPFLEKWLKSVPDDIEAGEVLGLAYHLVGDYPQAEQVWQRTLELDPDHEELLRRLFVLSHDSGELQSALAYGERLTKVNPWNYEYWGRLAHVLGQLGRLDEGIAAAEKAIAINPAVVNIYQWLAEVCAARGEQEKSERYRQRYEALAE